MKMAENDSGGSFTTGFLIGAIAGGIAGILMAPKTGTETRAQLVEQSETWRAKAEEAAANLRERVGPTVDEIRDRVAPMAEQVGVRMGRSGVTGPAADGGPAPEVVAEADAPEEGKKKA